MLASGATSPVSSGTVNKKQKLSTELDLDQHEFLHTSEELMEDSVEVSGRVHTRFSRAAPEHLRPATARETFLHDINSANLLPSQFEQVLPQGHVVDGAWTDLLDRTSHHRKQWRDEKETTLMTKDPKVKIQQSECDIDRNGIRQTQQLTSKTR